jgi:hypothetical protein
LQDWPELVKAELPPDLLPRFSADEVELIKGTADFFAIDVSFYLSALIPGVSRGSHISSSRRHRSLSPQSVTFSMARMCQQEGL